MNDNDSDIDQLVRMVLGQIAPEADLATLDPDAALREELDIDSMDFLNFVIGLHEATGVELPERDYALLDTFGGCVEYLRAHTAATPHDGRRP